MVDDEFQIDPDMVGSIMGNVDGLTGSTQSTVSDLAGTVLDGACFAGIGSSVASANAALQSNLNDSLSQTVRLIQNTYLDVGTATQGYVSADGAVAQAFGGGTDSSIFPADGSLLPPTTGGLLSSDSLQPADGGILSSGSPIQPVSGGGTDPSIPPADGGLLPPTSGGLLSNDSLQPGGSGLLAPGAAVQSPVSPLLPVSGGSGAPTAGPGGTNEVPLPPWNNEQQEIELEGGPNADQTTYAMMRFGTVPWMQHNGWDNASGLFNHYLDNTGTDYNVDPATLRHDVPSFDTAVTDYVAGQRAPGHFESGWTNFGTDTTDAQGNLVTGANGKLAQESLDWYYGLHHWRYNVVGDTTVGDDGGLHTDYHVDIFKPYVFHGADLNLPGGISDLTGLKFPQSMIQHLNSVGLARNFYVRGGGDFTYDSSTLPPP